MPSEVDLDQIVSDLNALDELLESNPNLINRQPISDFVSYHGTEIRLAVSLGIGWATVTDGGAKALEECYANLESICVGGVDYFLENAMDCSLSDFKK
jgi:hypothetical protein